MEIKFFTLAVIVIITFYCVLKWHQADKEIKTLSGSKHEHFKLLQQQSTIYRPFSLIASCVIELVVGLIAYPIFIGSLQSSPTKITAAILIGIPAVLSKLFKIPWVHFFSASFSLWSISLFGFLGLLIAFVSQILLETPSDITPSIITMHSWSPNNGIC